MKAGSLNGAFNRCNPTPSYDPDWRLICPSSLIAKNAIKKDWHFIETE